MIEFPIDKVSDFLNAKSEVLAVIPWWVRFGNKMWDPQENTLLLNIISDWWEDYLKIARIEARLLLGRNATPSSWLRAFDVINSIILDKCNNKLWFIDGFNFDDIRWWQTTWPRYDMQDRQVMIKEYLFYYNPNQNA